MKKFLAVLLTFLMVSGLSLIANAEGTKTYTIRLENSEAGHTYQAYQIFKGDFAPGKLSNIVWGSGVTSEGQTKMGSAEAKAATLTDETAVKLFADELHQYLNEDAVAGETSDHLSENGGCYDISGLEAGYYLVKDKDTTQNKEDGAYTSYILKLTNDLNMKVKQDKPTSHKKVDDHDDSNTDENAVAWHDSADYDIGDMVPFKLTGTLPSNYADYSSYKLVFHDEQSEGLLFDPSTMKVTVNTFGTSTEVKSGYVIRHNDDHIDTGEAETHEACLDSACTFEIELTDVRKLKDANGSHIVTTKDSVITVEYSSKLTGSAVVFGAPGNPNTMYMEYSNNPNNEGVGTSTTQEDKVVVFTYKTIINKVNSEKQPLAGAAFSLEKKMQDNSWKQVSKYTIDGDNSPTTFTFAGLDDGVYRLTETETPAGYNTIEPVIFEILANHDPESSDPKLQSIHANQIDENGITITKDYVFDATIVLEGGTITSDIVNKSGLVLPETGGIGTTVFYIVGAVLMIGAAVVLITRKRMDNDDK